MPRIRFVTTPIRSQPHLVRALAEVGLPNAESYDTAAALVNWRGVPTGVSANVIVRRSQLGASSDDLGFVRNQSGTFDAVLSEMHFFRFNMAWLEDLTKRHDRLAEADGVASTLAAARKFESRDVVIALNAKSAAPLASPPPVPAATAARDPIVALPKAPTAPAERAASTSATTRTPIVDIPMSAPPSLERSLERARSDSEALLADLALKHKGSVTRGCVLTLLIPLFGWVFLSRAYPNMNNFSGFIEVMILGAVVLSIYHAARMGQSARIAVMNFERRFPRAGPERDAALHNIVELTKRTGSKYQNDLTKRFVEMVRAKTRSTNLK